MSGKKLPGKPKLGPRVVEMLRTPRSGVQKGTNGAPAPGIQDRGASREWNYKNLNAVTDDFSYCKSTKTFCMDLILRNLFFVNTNLYVLRCQ